MVKKPSSVFLFFFESKGNSYLRNPWHENENNWLEMGKKVYGSKRKLLRRITRTEPRDSSRNLSAIFSTREISFPFQTLNFGLQFEKLAVKECRGIQREKFGGNFVENSSGLRDFKQKSVIRQNEQT